MSNSNSESSLSSFGLDNTSENACKVAVNKQHALKNNKPSKLVHTLKQLKMASFNNSVNQSLRKQPENNTNIIIYNNNPNVNS